MLDRLWRYRCSLQDGLRIGLIAFNETKASAANVDFPADSVLYRPGSFEIQEARYSIEEMSTLDARWGEAIGAAADKMKEFTGPFFAKLDAGPPAATHFGDNVAPDLGTNWP
jgi:predicted proteasome-type protease